MTVAPMNILLVDDQAKNLLALQAIGDCEDLHVLIATDGQQALELLLTHEVGLVFLDAQMPGLDGCALVDLMRSSQRTTPVPIIFVTAFAPDGPPRWRGCEHGAVDWLYKPVHPQVLRSKVLAFLDLHRQRQQLVQRRAELQRVTRLNALMVDALSHDIRTPLAVLTLNAELVSRHQEAPALQEAGARLKAALLMLNRQVDHLVNLAAVPAIGETPNRAPGDLAALVRQRLQLLPPQPGQPELLFVVQGDGAAVFDAPMLACAVDHLLRLMRTHGHGQALQVELDGQSSHTVTLSLKLPQPLGTAARAALLHATTAAPGMTPSPAAPGLDAAQRVARAHGGSLIGRSNGRDGTLLELVLPRDLP